MLRYWHFWGGECEACSTKRVGAKRALFIVSERPEHGRGHAVRCGALANELRTRGWVCDWNNDRAGMPDIGIVDVRGGDGWLYHVGDLPYVQIDDNPVSRARVLGNREAYPKPALIVNGCAAATPEMYADSGARKVLAGPEYALLRPEFRAVSWGQYGFSSSHDVYDLRTASRESAFSLARIIAASRGIITAGGMRAMEAACVGVTNLEIVIESEDQRLNAALSDPEVSRRVDGLGCIRVADEIERLVS